MESPPSGASSVHIWQLLALVVSLAALAGSLYLSVWMNLKACPLCIYERTFMMGVVGILLLGWVPSGAAGSGLPVLLSLPLAIGGLGVAAFHVYLELAGVLECPAGLGGVGSAPLQSLAAFVVVTVLIGMAVFRSARGATGRITGVGAAILGVLFAGAALVSAPPLPPHPAEPYVAPLDGCRPSVQPGGQTGQSP